MPIPFQDVYSSFLFHALSVVRKEQIPQSLIADSAWQDLTGILSERLSTQASLALGSSFYKFRAIHNPLALFTFELNPGDSLYKQFVQHIRKDDFSAFTREFPVCARLMTNLVEQWISFVQEFCRRLHQDLPQINSVFTGPEAAGKLIRASASGSDRHNHGRSVLQLKFESGLRLVYKPRGIHIERAFFQFLNWMNSRSIPIDLMVPRCLDRGKYGWTEWVERRSCINQNEAKAFFFRYGMLLCTTHILNGTDGHAENLVACGDQPVLVDAETLMQPGAWLLSHTKGLDDIQVSRQSADLLSILNTGLLPAWHSGQNGEAYDVAAISGQGRYQTGMQVPECIHPNTDCMEIRMTQVVANFSERLPLLNGEPLSVRDYEPQLLSGFSRMYQFLLRNKKQLLARSGPLKFFRGCETRLLYRPTQTYALLARQLVLPEYLRNETERSIQIEVLANPMISTSNKNQQRVFRRIYDAEREAIQRADIPVFTASVNHANLRSNGRQIVSQMFAQSGMKAVRQKIRSMTPSDLKHQKAVIRAVLEARFTDADSGTENLFQRQPDFPSTQRSEPGKWIDAAIEIARNIERRMVRDPNGDLNSIALTIDPSTGKLHLSFLAHDLYGGRCGIALFFAGLSAITKERKFHDTAMKLIEPIRKIIRTKPEREAFVRRFGFGLFHGIAGLLYTFAKLNELVDESGLLQEGSLFLESITTEQLKRQGMFDLGAGAAGTIFGLLNFSRASNQKAACLEKALLCGQYLLNHRSVSPSGHRVWPSVKYGPLTGFSHGASGNALALFLLHKESGIGQFLDAANEAVDFENFHFSREKRNWPDFRLRNANGEPVSQVSWCHGAVGIGLSRIQSVSLTDHPAIWKDIEHAVRTTLPRSSITNADSLCCGNFGRLELLVLASSFCRRPEWKIEAEKRAVWLTRRMQSVGCWQVFRSRDGQFVNPSFFQGTAGIGYQFLRLDL